LAASFTLNALVPSWQAPQNFPASISFMVISAAPFFILKMAGWQALHFAFAWLFQSKTTLPPFKYTTVLPGPTANAGAVKTITIRNATAETIDFLMDLFTSSLFEIF
jgi:hypothetical protein